MDFLTKLTLGDSDWDFIVTSYLESGLSIDIFHHKEKPILNHLHFVPAPINGKGGIWSILWQAIFSAAWY